MSPAHSGTGRSELLTLEQLTNRASVPGPAVGTLGRDSPVGGDFHYNRTAASRGLVARWLGRSPPPPKKKKPPEGDVYDVMGTVRCLWTQVSDSLVGAALWLGDSTGDNSVVELSLGAVFGTQEEKYLGNI